VGVDVGVSVGPGVEVSSGGSDVLVGIGTGVKVKVGNGVKVGVGEPVGVDVGVGDGVKVPVGSGVNVAVLEGGGMGVSVAVEVGTMAACRVGVVVGSWPMTAGGTGFGVPSGVRIFSRGSGVNALGPTGSTLTTSPVSRFTSERMLAEACQVCAGLVASSAVTHRQRSPSNNSKRASSQSRRLRLSS